ncbi:conserved hypothetical protein [Dethiosulfovibrio peptidovorans DSM 11002]|uniref:DUF6305 domain-containing protein n=1 Tax=Dethiosulfovibrio peptidovorans DSM 11002 TaxID=469381 RepID=D2Z589_9BACT|nr:DUF6305 family protein [Dethiosulfovibrio peptidovorans]EFC90648.1 conserved hypothetical protein [Dethiosulfovibrio peptidovorans DSM 11002]
MRRNTVVLAVLVSLFSFFVGSAMAAVTGDAPLKGDEPLLITNAGQGPGGKMGRLLVSRSKAVKDMTYNAEPTPEDILSGGYKTVLVMIGSSAKGLGASGITIDDEIDRLGAIMETCKKEGIQVIAAHIEGKARRGKPGSADERSIDVVAPYAQGFIVKNDSDWDGRFTDLAEANGAPLTIIDETIDFMDVVKDMYSK